MIAVVKNITRRQHTPSKHPANPIIKRDKPWEGIPYFRSSAFNIVWDPQDENYKCCDPAPNLPSLISRIFSGYGPNWGGLQTRWV